MFVTFFFPATFLFSCVIPRLKVSTQISNHLASTYTLSDSCIRLCYKTERLRAALDAEDCTYDFPDSVPLEGLAIQIREKGVDPRCAIIGGAVVFI